MAAQLVLVRLFQLISLRWVTVQLVGQGNKGTRMYYGVRTFSLVVDTHL